MCDESCQKHVFICNYLFLFFYAGECSAMVIDFSKCFSLLYSFFLVEGENIGEKGNVFVVPFLKKNQNNLKRHPQHYNSLHFLSK